MRYKQSITGKLTNILSALLLFVNFAHAKDSLLVSPEWLAKHLNDENLVILDARPVSEYDKLHIKNAISLPATSTFRQTPPTDRLATESYLTKLYKLAGIDENTQVIVYDSADFRQAARVIWGLNVYGHDNARLLTITFPYWQASALPVSTETPKIKPGNFKPRIQPKRLASKFQTLLAMDDENAVLIDVRSSEEFRGEKSRSRLYGHIPNAININRTLMVKKGELGVQLKTAEELKTLFSPLIQNKTAVTYCQKGNSSSLVYLLLREFGNDNVSVYDGSWYEWGNSFDLPIEGPGESPAIPVIENSPVHKDDEIYLMQRSIRNNGLIS